MFSKSSSCPWCQGLSKHLNLIYFTVWVLFSLVILSTLMPAYAASEEATNFISTQAPQGDAQSGYSSVSLSHKYATSPTESSLLRSHKNVENAFSTVRNTKTPQDLVTAKNSEVQKINTNKALEKLKVSDEIQALSDESVHPYHKGHFQSPTSLFDDESDFANAPVSNVNLSALKPFATSPQQSSIERKELATATPSNFIADLDRNKQRALNYRSNAALQKVNVGNNSLQESSPDHVTVKEVQHRNDFASSYRRRMMSGEEYSSYFNWISDQEIEELHARIKAERAADEKNPNAHISMAEERTAHWSSLANANIAKNQLEAANQQQRLSISSDPRQEHNLSIVLGITSDQSKNITETDKSTLAEVLAREKEIDPNFDPSLGLSYSENGKLGSSFNSVYGSQSDNNKNNNEPVYESSLIGNIDENDQNDLNDAQLSNLSSQDLNINLSQPPRDTGELSQKSLLKTENPFQTDMAIENTLSQRSNDSNSKLSKYLDQVLPKTENTQQTSAYNQTSKEPVYDSFQTSSAKVMENKDNRSAILPFKVSVYLEKNNVVFNINIENGSYIYQHSLSILGNSSMSFGQPELPDAVKHEDMQGISNVYFNNVSLTVPVNLCKTGDILSLNYQGCDAAGICYPPQKFSVAMPNAIQLTKEEEPTLVTLLNESVQVVNDNHEEGIAQLLRDNLLLGLIVCFILGVGLDLTPCVLPMLPIFSTMLIGARKNKINVKDDVEVGVEEDEAVIKEKIEHEKKQPSNVADTSAKVASTNEANAINEANATNANLNGAVTDKSNSGTSNATTKTTDKAQASSTVDATTKADNKSQTDASTQDNKTASAPKKKPSKWQDQEFRTILIQNLGYTLGLSFSYMVLGLLFASIGASLHNILQSPIVIVCVALLLCICALSCAGVIEFTLPNFITNPLQAKLRRLYTGNFPGAVMFGMLSALISSPCTSAPLAGALIYVFTTGNMMIGAIYFLAIGLGMSFPLFIIGVFGTKILIRSTIFGALIKRILVVVLLITAYYMVSHLLGAYELIIRTLLFYIIFVYLCTSVSSLFLKHRLQMSRVLTIAFICLLPSYLSYNHFTPASVSSRYEFFTPAKSLYEIEKIARSKYSFVVFTAEWCTNCKQMADQVYSSDYFILASNDLNKVVVDLTNTKDPNTEEIIKRYDIIGVPCYIILDPAGNVVEKRLGIQSSNKVIKSIHRVNYQKQYGL